MKRLVLGLMFVAGTLIGCAQNHFNVPVENVAEKVKILGVAPIFIDTDSDINYPQKDLLIQLIADLNRKYEPQLVRKLQSTGNFNAVTQLADEPRQLFSSIMARRENRDDANIQYNKYFWKNNEIGAYIKQNRLDAVMVVVISGLTKTSKIYSSNLMNSLETKFNFLTMTAQIVGPDGTVLWEYPNFRRQLLTYQPLVNLQYPDFSESEANMSRETAVRFKSIDGIRRTLEKKKSDWLLRETTEPEIYGNFFDDMTSLIKFSVDKQEKGAAVDGKQLPAANEPSKTATEQSKPVVSQPAPAPAITAPANETSAKVSAETPGIPAESSKEIVPATESTR